MFLACAITFHADMIRNLEVGHQTLSGEGEPYIPSFHGLSLPPPHPLDFWLNQSSSLDPPPVSPQTHTAPPDPEAISPLQTRR